MKVVERVMTLSSPSLGASDTRRATRPRALVARGSASGTPRGVAVTAAADGTAEGCDSIRENRETCRRRFEGGGVEVRWVLQKCSHSWVQRCANPPPCLRAARWLPVQMCGGRRLILYGCIISVAIALIGAFVARYFPSPLSSSGLVPSTPGLVPLYHATPGRVPIDHATPTLDSAVLSVVPSFPNAPLLLIDTPGGAQTSPVRSALLSRQIYVLHDITCQPPSFSTISRFLRADVGDSCSNPPLSADRLCSLLPGPGTCGESW